MSDPTGGGGGGGGVTGSAWVARRECITFVGFFTHTYLGCGEDLMLNIVQGSHNENTLSVVQTDTQRYYFKEKGVFARHILKYRKKWLTYSGVPVRCAYLPCTLIHMYHGELASKQTRHTRHTMFTSRHFHMHRHLAPNPHCNDFIQWSEAFRKTGINHEYKASLGRNQTVRDKVLLRMAKTQKCMSEMKKHVGTVQQCKEQTKQRERTDTDHLAYVLQQCLKSFDTVQLGM
jgi:hypothetical protein